MMARRERKVCPDHHSPHGTSVGICAGEPGLPAVSSQAYA